MDIYPKKKASHKAIHNHHYGFHLHNDNELFTQQILEINQAGISWETIFKKESTIRKAYANFNVHKVASYTNTDREKLMSSHIIHNRLKINAAIEKPQNHIANATTTH